MHADGDPEPEIFELVVEPATDNVAVLNTTSRGIILEPGDPGGVEPPTSSTTTTTAPVPTTIPDLPVEPDPEGLQEDIENAVADVDKLINDTIDDLGDPTEAVDELVGEVNDDIDDVFVDALDLLNEEPRISIGSEEGETEVENNTSGDANTASVSVSVDGPAVHEITVGYVVRAGTAKPGSDYDSAGVFVDDPASPQGRSGTVTFGRDDPLPGVDLQSNETVPIQKAKTINVPLVADEIGEDDETFVIELFDPDGAKLDNDRAVVTIEDDDPLLLLDDVAAVDEDAGTARATFRRAGQSSATVTARMRTLPSGNAVGDRDYTPTAQEFSIPAGDTSRRTFEFPILDDDELEGDEQVPVELALVGDDGTETVVATDAVTIRDVEAGTLLGVTDDHRLFRFNPARPGNVTGFGSIQGLDGTDDERPVGVDVRPSDGAIFLATLDASEADDTDDARIYRVALGGQPTAKRLGDSRAVDGSEFGVDVDPVSGELRIVSDADENLRFDPPTRKWAGDDGSLAYDSGDRNGGEDPTVAASAHTGAVPGATSSTLYGIDVGLDTLVRQADSSGDLRTVGSLGDAYSSFSGPDPTDVTSIDVMPDGTAVMVVNEQNNVGDDDDEDGLAGLWRVYLESGTAGRVGDIGSFAVDEVVAVTTAAPGTVRFTTGAMTVDEATGTAEIPVRRTGGFGEVTVHYAPSGGTAEAGADYRKASGSVTIAPGTGLEVVTVPIVDDDVDEGTETLTLSITGTDGGARVGRPDEVTLRIRDDDRSSGSRSGTRGSSGAAARSGDGYYVLDETGGIHTFGGASFAGSLPQLRSEGVRVGDAAVIDIAATPSGGGYYVLDETGGIHTFGDAKFLGSLPGLRAEGVRVGDAAVIDMAVTPSGGGYYVLDETGGIHTFGDAKFHGSLPQLRADGIQVGSAAPLRLDVSPTGAGYYVLDEMGGIHTFGDAKFLGSLPGLRAEGVPVGDAPVIDLGVTPSGGGYYVLDETGGIHTFGDAKFRGSLPQLRADGVPVGASGTIRLSVTPSGGGYYVLDETGGIHTFGDAKFQGSLPGLRAEGVPVGDASVIDMAVTPSGDR